MIKELRVVNRELILVMSGGENIEVDLKFNRTETMRIFENLKLNL